MHPAFSVIFFTVSSGTGYGLLFMFGLLTVLGRLPADPLLNLVGLGIAIALITFGLLSSTYHLGHRERAIGALSQWRTSWLSREGVLAVAVYVPVAVMAYIQFFRGGEGGGYALWAALSAVLAAVTVYCTAMIYRSLATIHQWHNQWTAPVYLSLGLAGGGLVLLMVLVLFGVPFGIFNVVVAGLVALGWIVKFKYWRFIDTTSHQSTPETATGLGQIGKVRKLEGPHTEDNYLLTEMGYMVARKHAVKLRRYVHVTGFGLPLVMSMATSVSPVLSVAAVLSFLLGAVIERWLFFAEAKHTVTLYYGAESV